MLIVSGQFTKSRELFVADMVRSEEPTDGDGHI